jgi:hypothetical protein
LAHEGIDSASVPFVRVATIPITALVAPADYADILFVCSPFFVCAPIFVCALIEFALIARHRYDRDRSAAPRSTAGRGRSTAWIEEHYEPGVGVRRIGQGRFDAARGAR